MGKYTSRHRYFFDVNKFDFYRALRERDFVEMSEIYNEMVDYEDIESVGGKDRYFFTEVLDGYVIEIPFVSKSRICSFGENFYYALSEDRIIYIIDEGGNDKVFDYYKNEIIEADKVKFTEEKITVTPKAVKQLKLSVGDIVKITLDDKVFEIDRYEPPFYFM